MPSLSAEAKKLLDLRRAADEAEAEYKKRAEKKQEQELHFWELLEDEGMSSFSADLGPGYGKFTLTRGRTIYSRILDRDVAADALKRLGRSPEEIFRQDIRKAPANELVKECLEHGQDIPDGFDYSETKYITATKRK